MGIESEQFVHPERISSQLFCAICTNVLENPVITPSEQMFCEHELLEWFVLKGDQVCPITNMKLDPEKIVRPGRIIMNMLNELERYCLNRKEGCTWTGPNDLLKQHMKICEFKPRQKLFDEIARHEATIKLQELRLERLESCVRDLQERNEALEHENELLERKLRVYEAFFQEDGNNENSNISISAQSEISRLRDLSTFAPELRDVGKQKK